MSSKYLREDLTFSQANIQVLEEADVGGKKHLYLKGICIEGDKRNANAFEIEVLLAANISFFQNLDVGLAKSKIFP